MGVLRFRATRLRIWGMQPAGPPGIPPVPARLRRLLEGDGRLLPIGLVAIAAVAAYINTLDNSFVYDDIPQVVNNPWIRDVSFLRDAFTSNVWTFQGTATNYYRPMMHAVFMATHHLFGLSPTGFHVVNVLLHAVSSILVYLLLGRLVREPGPGAVSSLLSPPLVGAILFAVHPIQTEAVAWVSALPELLFSFFALLSLLLFTAQREGPGAGAGVAIVSAGFFLLAALSKETALSLLPLFAALELVLPERRSTPATLVKRLLPPAAAAAVYFVMRLNALGALAPLRRHMELSHAQVLLNGIHLFAGYLGKLLWPLPLTVYHPFESLTSFLAPAAIAALAACSAFAGLCALAWRHNRPALLGLLFVAVPLLPVLYAPALGENVFSERYLYFPSVGLALFAAALLSRTRIRRRGPAAALGAIVLVAAGLCLTGTIRRNAAWKDDLTLWTDAVGKAPGSAVPHYNLGCHLLAAGRIDEAIDSLRTAIRIAPAAIAHTSLGSAYEVKGMLEEAIEQHRLALRLAPRDPEAHFRLGTVLAAVGRREEAIGYLETAVLLDSSNARFREGLRGASTPGVPQASGHAPGH